jgi:signal peptidase I
MTRVKSESRMVADTKTKQKSSLRENIEAILIAVVLALFIRTFIVQAFKIPSGSMTSTLVIGDHILVNKFLYGIKIPFLDKTIVPIKDPERGDIIVFKFPEDPTKDFIKRVIGIAGDEIQIRDKKVYINGVLSSDLGGFHTDSRILPKRMQPRDNFGPVTIPSNKLFMMGDNRDHSYDSRFWGFVDLKAVKGKAFIIYWSWDKNSFGIRWSRIGQLLK